MADVKVNLGSRSYVINIADNNIKSIGSFLKSIKVTNKVLIVSDDNVSKLYGNKLLKSMQDEGFAAELYSIKPGEDSKALEIAMGLYTKAIEMGLDRKSPIIALGGGVVGDLTGFIAATYLRGVPFVQIPTSLLAQVDSSVGGKVAVNHPMGKNLIGAFYQPKGVFIDVSLLQSLPDRELHTGLAEVIKYGVIADKQFFSFLNEHVQEIMNKESVVLTEIIKRSCEIKASVVEQDEEEAGLRAILNFGHTIGHAIEADTGFSVFNHGEAVAIGMYGAALISNYLGLCTKESVEQLRKIIEKFKLPLIAPECSPEDLQHFLTRDKKVVGNKLNWVLMKDIGSVMVSTEVTDEAIMMALNKITEG